MLQAVPVFIEGKEYRLRLSASACIELEGYLQCSVLGGLSRFDNLAVVLRYFHAALRCHHPEIPFSGAGALYDQYVEEGGCLSAFLDILLEVLRISGFIRGESEER